MTGNKLIETYTTGRVPLANGVELGRKRGMPEKHENWYDVVSVHDCNYHKNWALLMPVIEKISHIKWGEDTDSPDTYYPRTFGMLNAETGKPMFRFNLHACFEADTLIEAAWLAVVDFIKTAKHG